MEQEDNGGENDWENVDDNMNMEIQESPQLVTIRSLVIILPQGF